MRSGFEAPQPSDASSSDLTGYEDAGAGDTSDQPGPDAASGPNLLTLDSTQITNTLDHAIFQGGCYEDVPISVRGAIIENLPCAAGRFVFSPTASSDGDYEYVLSQQVNDALHEVTARWIRDTSGPEFLADRFILGDGRSSIQTPFVNLSFAIHDSLSLIVDVCVKRDETTTPSSQDPCWMSLSDPILNIVPARDIETDAFPFNLGFLPGTKTVLIWARDALGNISVLSNQGQGTAGLDLATVRYEQSHPPVLTEILATSVQSPSRPPTQAELTVAAGDDLFIEWNAHDDDALTDQPISLFYTIDDINFVPIATDLLNDVNGACSTSTTATGCYHWSAGVPVSDYFKIRVSAVDRTGLIGAATSTALNTSPVRFLAGNTDPGTNTSGTAAMFFNDMGTNNDHTDLNSLVVTSTGRVYFLDKQRGILEMQLPVGIQRVFIPLAASSSGDGGPISLATVSKSARISLDAEERLLIYDKDRIRRVDTHVSPMTIDTIIGGGTETGDDVAALDLKITALGSAYRDILFTPLPNGDIYFQSEPSGQRSPAEGFRIRIYRALTKRVESLIISGTLDAINPGQEISHCQFVNIGIEYQPENSEVTFIQAIVRARRDNALCPADPTSSSYMVEKMVSIAPQTGQLIDLPPTGRLANTLMLPLTSPNGQLFFISRSAGSLMVLDPETKLPVAIAGSSTARTPCVDGTDKSECQIEPSDMYLARDGQIYFSDRGRIRIIAEDNSVLTILGHGFFFGDGREPMSARFGKIKNFALWNDGAKDQFILLDGVSLRFREFSEGGVVHTIAGVGINAPPYAPPSTSLPADEQALSIDTAGVVWPSFAVDPSNGALFFNRGHEHVSKLDRSQNRWVDVVGGGTLSYYDASIDGQAGDQIKLHGSLPKVLAYSARGVLVAHERYDSSIFRLSDIALNLYEPTNGTVSRFAYGAGPTDGLFCADSTSLLSCILPPARNFRAATQNDAGQFILVAETRKDVHIEQANGSLGLLTTLDHHPGSIAYRRISGSESVLYYCGYYDGLLYRVNLETEEETALAFPVPSMECTGERLVYSSTRDSLVFAFEQNGLGGLAEWLSPP